jgi:endoglucanase
VVANRERLKALWTAIAGRYADETAIAAFDLINEPLPQSTEGYFTYMQEVIDALRTVDGNHMIIVEEAFNDDFAWQTLDETNLAYDTHFYNPWSYAAQPPMPT